MSDFILIYPKIKRGVERNAFPPFVFLQLAAALEKANFTSTLIDARVEKDFMHKIEQEIKKNPLFVGITSMTGFQTFEGMRIAKFVKKKNIKIPVVWGGVHASFLPEQVINNQYVDVVAMGEGESTVVSLAKEYRSYGRIVSEIKGIVIKKDGKIVKIVNNDSLDLDLVPMPAWHLIKDRIERYYLGSEKCMSIITSRGCPHRCSFCYNANFNKRVFRARSVENVLAEIEFLHQQFGVTKVRFSDDNILTDKNRVVKICDELQRKGNVVPVYCDVRVDYLDNELLSYLVKRGVKEFYLGIEHGSQKMLDLLCKGTKVEGIEEAITLLGQHTLGGHTYSFMIGLPGETEEDIKKTWFLAKWIVNIDQKAHILLNIYTPYPGTELMNILVKEGYKMPDDLYGWCKYHWFSAQGKGWIQNMRLVKSLTTIFRFAFTRSDNKLVRFLSRRAKNIFLTGKPKPYLEFELLYYLLNVLKI